MGANRQRPVPEPWPPQGSVPACALNVTPRITLPAVIGFLPLPSGYPFRVLRVFRAFPIPRPNPTRLEYDASPIRVNLCPSVAQIPPASVCSVRSLAFRVIRVFRGLLFSPALCDEKPPRFPKNPCPSVVKKYFNFFWTLPRRCPGSYVKLGAMKLKSSNGGGRLGREWDRGFPGPGRRVPIRRAPSAKTQFPEFPNFPNFPI